MPHGKNNTGSPVHFACPFCQTTTSRNTIRVTETVHKRHRWIIGCKCGARWVVEILEGPRT